MKFRLPSVVLVAIVLCRFASDLAAQSLDAGLVAHYNLDGNGLDSSGNGINGTLLNGATGTTDRFGISNAALYFGTGGGEVDGSGLNLANSSSSISLWIDKLYVGNGSNGGWFLRVGDVGASGQAMHLATDYGQSIRYSFYNDDFDISSPTLSANQWYNLIFTYDNTTNARQIFVNGNLAATNTASYGFSGDGNFAFGFQNIKLDDIRFYNRVLTPTDVAQIQSAPEPSSAVLVVGSLLLFTGRWRSSRRQTQRG